MPIRDSRIDPHSSLAHVGQRSGALCYHVALRVFAWFLPTCASCATPRAQHRASKPRQLAVLAPSRGAPCSPIAAGERLVDARLGPQTDDERSPRTDRRVSRAGRRTAGRRQSRVTLLIDGPQTLARFARRSKRRGITCMSRPTSSRTMRSAANSATADRKAPSSRHRSSRALRRDRQRHDPGRILRRDARRRRRSARVSPARSGTYAAPLEDQQSRSSQDRRRRRTHRRSPAASTSAAPTRAPRPRAPGPKPAATKPGAIRTCRSRPGGAQFQALFLATWTRAGGRRRTRSTADLLPGNRHRPVRSWSRPSRPAATIAARRPSTRPTRDAFRHATQRLWLTHAYFAPNKELRRALIDAARRGVDVRLIVPGFTDSGLIFHASRASYEELLAGGVRIYEQRYALLHAKTARRSTRRLSMVGSANLDMRSFLHNNEVNAVVVGSDFARAHGSALRARPGQARRELDLEQLAQASAHG